MPAVRTIAAIAAALACAAPASARAANCKVNLAPAFAFGAYDPLSATPVDVSGTISYGCSKSAAPVVIQIGAGGSGSFAARRMQSIASPIPLEYNVYVDAGRTRIWGDGSPGTWTVTAPADKNVVLPVHARVQPRQLVPSGTYADTLVMTLLF